MNAQQYGVFMDQKIKSMYRSAAHLLTNSFVLSKKKEYPQAHVMTAARRGLLRACLRFKPSPGRKFFHYAEFLIMISVRRCIAEEVPESRPVVVEYMPSNIEQQIEEYKASVPEEVRKARQEQRRRDAAKSIQLEKAVKQARLYRNLMKSKIRR